MAKEHFERRCLFRLDKNTRKKIQSIHHALSAAVSSINLSKRLLNDLEKASSLSTRDMPGEFGAFDGHFMVVEGGEKYPVPENYASKSKLVYGDTLKRIVQEDGKELFKQVERVKRLRIEGVLAKKDGRWCVVDAYGSHEVLAAAIKYYGVGEGDEVLAAIPQENTHAPFATLEGRVGKEEESVVEVEEEVVVEGKSEEKKATAEKVVNKAATKTKRAAKKTEEGMIEEELVKEENEGGDEKDEEEELR